MQIIPYLTYGHALSVLSQELTLTVEVDARPAQERGEAGAVTDPQPGGASPRCATLTAGDVLRPLEEATLLVTLPTTREEEPALGEGRESWLMML